MELVIGDKNLSSWSLRPWLVLKRAGQPFTETMVRLNLDNTTAEILRHSPTAKVPALKTDAGYVVWDSMAISVHVAEQSPGKVWPADQEARDFARSAACEMHSGFGSLRGECAMNLSLRTTKAISDATGADLRRLVALFSEGRKKFAANGPYLCGTWSVADAFYTPVATRIRTYGIKLSDYGDTGAAAEYVATLLAEPDFLEWERAALADVGAAA
jgi:glutathione S-transferase